MHRYRYTHTHTADKNNTIKMMLMLMRQFRAIKRIQQSTEQKQSRSINNIP